ncbi:MAG: hypothetical protein JXA33_08160 [Anaerolineae bacterium]|nr:hypothetical protein [Anaerolineae bacterium]
MISYLEYELHQGFIHNWLVAGPQEVPVVGVEGVIGRAGECARKLQVTRELYEIASGIVQTPVDRASFTLGDTELTWHYVRCLDDHFVDQSTFYHTWTYLRSWAYAQVSVWDGQEVTFILTTNGPADVWVNGEHVHRHEHFEHQDPARVSFTATLRENDESGKGNEILVRFEEVAARECPYVMALQLVGVDDEDVEVRIPTSVERVARRMMYERVFSQSYLEEEVNCRGAKFNLRWADDLSPRGNYQYQVQDDLGRTHISGELEAKPGEVVDVGHGFRLWERQYYVVLRPIPQEYYGNDIRYEWKMPIFVLDSRYSDTYYGTCDERRAEALKYAAERKENVFAEIAKMALERWDELDTELVLRTIAGINQRGDCSDFYLTGLLGVMYRYMDAPAFPESLKQPLKECVLNFKYWHDEPGRDAMCYTTENHSILFHTCEILAGQLYPDAVFSNVAQNGAWHREKGEALALTWLKRRAMYGFSEWDSNCYFEEDLLALSHLVDLAEHQEVVELAAVVMDKMLFTMAVNSYKGVFGSTHGRTYTRLIKGAQLEATSGIGRLLWGLGVFNPSIRGVVGLACSAYKLPTHITLIANELPEEMWHRERHIISEDGNEVNKVTYKTPDAMLCSAQDYHPGEYGYQQHIWQATLDHNAVVFVTHPPCMSEEGAHRPNFWHGNYILPRVAQWKDALIALHKLPADDWMGFTHAYFPAYAFDEYALQERPDGSAWAFARKGEGYLALFAAQGLDLVKLGPSAYRELRSYGQENVWLCYTGRAALDGSFEDFREKTLALTVDIQGLRVQCETLRGETLAFNWDGDLLRNGVVEPITGFDHYDGPYCKAELPATAMDIQVQDYLLRLRFAETDG